MPPADPLVPHVAYVLAHRSNEQALSQTQFAHWPIIQQRLARSHSHSVGSMIASWLDEALDELCAPPLAANNLQLIRYIDLRFRKQLPVRTVAQHMHYRREYLTRRWRRPALLHITATLIAQNCAASDHTHDCRWPGCPVDAADGICNR